MNHTLTSNARTACIKKFLYYFPKGFVDDKYYAWERGYKWEAHIAWENVLNQQEYKTLLVQKEYSEIALRAVRIETKTNLLFSFEKMALRDAIKPHEGAKAFAEGLYEYIYMEKNLINKGLKYFQKFWKNYPESKQGYVPGLCKQYRVYSKLA